MGRLADDEIETQAQRTANQLKSEITSSGDDILSVTVSSIYDGSRIFYGTNYEITSGGFIIIKETPSSATFNLGELKSYVISTNSLTLYY